MSNFKSIVVYPRPYHSGNPNQCFSIDMGYPPHNSGNTDPKIFLEMKKQDSIDRWFRPIKCVEKLLQSASKSYYKVRQLLLQSASRSYYKVWQLLLQSASIFFITKWDNFLLQSVTGPNVYNYYKVRRFLLQSVTAFLIITKCVGFYYKVWQLFRIITKCDVITKWDSTSVQCQCRMSGS